MVSKFSELVDKFNFPDTYSLNLVIHILCFRRFVPPKSPDSYSCPVPVIVEGE